jgi:hypothetical protein
MVLGSGGGPGGGRPAGAVGEGAARAGQQVGPVAEGPQPGAVGAANGGDGPGRMILGPGRSNVSLDKQDVGESWPLIRFLLDDPTYYAAYVEHVEQVSTGLIVPERLAAKYQALAELLAPYAAKEGKQAELEAAVQDLTTRTYERAQVAGDFLAGQPR